MRNNPGDRCGNSGDLTNDRSHSPRYPCNAPADSAHSAESSAEELISVFCAERIRHRLLEFTLVYVRVVVALIVRILIVRIFIKCILIERIALVEAVFIHVLLFAFVELAFVRVIFLVELLFLSHVGWALGFIVQVVHEFFVHSFRHVITSRELLFETALRGSQVQQNEAAVA